MKEPGLQTLWTRGGEDGFDQQVQVMRLPKELSASMWAAVMKANAEGRMPSAGIYVTLSDKYVKAERIPSICV